MLKDVLKNGPALVRDRHGGDSPAKPKDFLTEGGAMGALMRTFDWSVSPLGPPGNWPSSLTTTVGLMLRAEAQIVLF